MSSIRPFIRDLFHVFLVGLAFGGSALAQQWTTGPLKESKFELTGGKDTIEVSFLRDDIVEFDYKPEGKSDPHSPLLAGSREVSLRCELQPERPTGRRFSRLPE